MSAVPPASRRNSEPIAGWSSNLGSGCAKGPLLDLARSAHERQSPFVLIDNQQTGEGLLFSQPEEIIIAQESDDVVRALERIDKALARGATLAGYVGYRAGAGLDVLAMQGQRLGSRRPPCLWMAAFAERRQGRVDDDRQLRSASDPLITPLISQSDYQAMVTRALEHIRAGDIYQVNLTFPLAIAIGNALEYYAARRPRSAAPFGAIVANDEQTLLSFSPELFFRMADGKAETRPMKGTIARAADPAEDLARASTLRISTKDRAENLMIVDLLRNDLSRICDPGSVKVPALFSIERYPTVWQMTSTVSGVLRHGTRPTDLLRAMFPCGSITGAPKIMASRIIADLERWDRGIYTGSIGWMDRDNACFNVAIRTIDLHRGSGTGRLDAGAGIVADSVPSFEWRECLAKTRFAGRL